MNVFVIVMLLFDFFLLMLIIGWRRLWSKRGQTLPSPSPKLSVILPVRNEAHNIGNLLNDLLAQDYKNFELIVVDDHSADDTIAVIEKYSSEKITLLRNDRHGKKNAIAKGVDFASGEIIVTTDGDCHVTSSWLSEIEKVFRNDKIQFAFGGVRIQTENFFSELQAIEFSSLIGSGAAMSSFGVFSMCNGANLAYREKVFAEVNGYEGNLNVSSGDDEFLMRKVLARHPEGITFMTAKSAVVETQPQRSASSFFHQRLRWAGKWRSNTSVSTILIAFFVLAVQVSFISLLVAGIKNFDQFFLLTILSKIILEGIFLVQVCRFLGTRFSFNAFLILQLIYPFYVLLTGIASNFVKTSWKGRWVSTGKENSFNFDSNI